MKSTIKEIIAKYNSDDYFKEYLNSDVFEYSRIGEVSIKEINFDGNRNYLVFDNYFKKDGSGFVAAKDISYLNRKSDEYKEYLEKKMRSNRLEKERKQENEIMELKRQARLL